MTARFAVVDVETTGLDPQSSRVVECAIVTCSGQGDVIDEWSSLIAVSGAEEIGASWLHGISRASLHGAPCFADVIGEIVRRLRGTVIVGHCILFDLAHLAAEFSRVGTRFPQLGTASICTRELACTNLPPGSRTLAAVCTRLGFTRTDAHTALGDARTTASVLAAFVERGVDLGWGQKMARSFEVLWPILPAGGSEGPTTLARRRSA
ncbi:MAG: 3'-5' exonuclease [Acidimicrobiales bacterium]